MPGSSVFEPVAPTVDAEYEGTAVSPRPYPRLVGWLPTTALALGGSNQSLFLIGALFIGQESIPGQGSAAVPLLIVGLLLSLAAAPGWTELALLSPNRVGGIAAACTDAFRPYSSLLSALAGCCYWWGWVPTCGLTALMASAAIHQWLAPGVPVNAIAVAIIVVFVAISLGGLRWIARAALPIGIAAAAIAFASAVVPVFYGHVDWHRATTFSLTLPFPGWFGGLTSVMAGLYLIGFAAPAFESATCHVGETIDPARNVPRAVVASASLAVVYFVVLPVVWLGALGPGPLGGDLATELGPTFAPLFGGAAKALAVGFIIVNMLNGTLQPLAGASRTLAQLADDGIFPRFLSRRSSRHVPWVATLITAAAAIGFLFIGDPIWLIAAANFAYLIAIGLPSVAVWLLRRDAPDAERPYRAPRGTISLGLVAACVWMISAVFGFEQFGLPTVLLGLALAYSGGLLYAWRKFEDRRRLGLRGITHTLQLTFTSAMVAVLAFDGAGYLVAIANMHKSDAPTVAALQDIFVVVAMLTIGVGLILPGMISESATRDLATANATLVRGTEALRSEIAERAFAEERLSHVASHDELTGLANRALFMKRFDESRARERHGARCFTAVLFLDLDRFKVVNDSLGHLMGDALLVAVARRLAGCMRPGDTLARMGGDEFTILMDGIASETEATELARRVLDAMEPAFVAGDREIFASASIGIAIAHDGTDSAEDTVRNADIAMYRAKTLGKARFEVFAPGLLAQAVSLLQLEHDLKRALERNEFVLFYQPIVSLGDGSLDGLEALVRWRHPERGLLAPDAFVPAAEESGAILAIGAWVIDEACRQAASWRERFARPIRLSVNVSAKQFSSAALLTEIESALVRHALPAAHLRIEITESAIMASSELATATLEALRDLGVRVHLDDFGTGYSSLGYLQRFPVDTLKVDRSFVSSSGDGVANVEIVRTIASLARGLSMKTTVEGIETQRQLDVVRGLGCTSAQGYFFSKPVDAEAATRLVAGWRPARAALVQSA